MTDYHKVSPALMEAMLEYLPQEVAAGLWVRNDGKGNLIESLYPADAVHSEYAA